MRSAPTLKIWMTPFSLVAMLEKLALLRIAFCRAPVLSRISSGSILPVIAAGTAARTPEGGKDDGNDFMALVRSGRDHTIGRSLIITVGESRRAGTRGG